MSSTFYYFFLKTQTINLILVTTRLPSHIAAAKRIMERGLQVDCLNTHFSCDLTFESNLNYVLRFMVKNISFSEEYNLFEYNQLPYQIDRKVVGANWITLPAGKFTLRHDESSKQSTCQLECDIRHDAFISHDPSSPDPNYSAIAPLRILSFDIECAGRRGVFPEPQVDPVIQIANMVTIQGIEYECV